MKEENKEIRYGYIINEYEYSEMMKEFIELTEIEYIYSSKEECLEKAKEKLLKCGYDYEKGYIYIIPLRQYIDIDDYIVDKIIKIVEDYNENNMITNEIKNKQELKSIIEDYFNKNNNWSYVEIIKEDIETHKVFLKKQIYIEKTE